MKTFYIKPFLIGMGHGFADVLLCPFTWAWLIWFVIATTTASGADIAIKPGDNVQQKIDGSAPGDRLMFQEGTYNGFVKGKGQRQYIGVYNAKVTGGGNGNFTWTFDGQSEFSITGLTFDNANLKLNNCSKVFVHTPMQNNHGRGGDSAHGIFASNLHDSKIIGDFKNMRGDGSDTCIFGYDPINCEFVDGSFIETHEAIHFFWKGRYYDPSAGLNNPTNVKISRNLMLGNERHPIELQNSPNGLEVSYNWIGVRYENGINISCATGGPDGNGGYQLTNNINVHHNVLDNGNYAMPGGWSQCMGVEAMGRISVTDNWMVNCGQGVAVTYNPPNTEIKRNKFKNNGGHEIVSDVPHNKYIAPSYDLSQANDFNYTGAIPTYAQLIAMAGGAPPPPPPPPPPPDPNPVGTFTIAVTGKTDTTVQFGLSNLPSGVANVRMTAVTTGGGEKWATYTMPSSGIVGPYTRNWNYNFQGEAVNAANAVIARSNTISDVKVIGSTTPPPPPPPPPTSGDLIVTGTFNGKPVLVIYQIKDGVVQQTVPTTRPSN